MPFRVTKIAGVRSSKRRGIMFLENAEEHRVDAKAVFDALKNKYDLLSRFDLWIGGGICDKYFHGWPNIPNYKECFVFKWKQAGTQHRLYGFLINPELANDPAFQICILVSHAQKTDKTDFGKLDYINTVRNSTRVLAAIKLALSEKK
jgi:hypothetical protein